MRTTVTSWAIAVLLAAGLVLPRMALAGTQAEENLAPSVLAGLQKSISDLAIPTGYVNQVHLQPWLADMSRRLAPRVPDERERRDLLATVHYEAVRAGLDPQLVLGVIHHESGFKKYAVSPANARGYMQVMPFWVRQIGTADQNLFNLRINLRYGCTILRHYLAVESGDLFRALGRYNGSLGREEYPNPVRAAMLRYEPSPPGVPVQLGAAITPAQ